MELSGKHERNEKSDTDRTEVPSPIPENGFPRDAWNCDNCQALMYNTKPNHHHPVAGAPMPHFVS
jgi:hypothetical protein